ncbi:uncharacterized protein RSE6_05214 [Rhynchosporium secalis]|uniref:NB-ARC domain-containing protein n=1 Tax=Rhynchosporium secalis TaxID=38038 RepID=A0A1E1M776_RHYSE|nr:uncharacterized protein RSE6_05214 [Rhynchosporium secalis]
MLPAQAPNIRFGNRCLFNRLKIIIKVNREITTQSAVFVHHWGHNQPDRSTQWTPQNWMSPSSVTGTTLLRDAKDPWSHVTVIKPTLGHFRQCTDIFETHLPAGLHAAYFWGIIGVLLQLTIQDSQALLRIPKMLKALGYKAQAFNRHYSTISQGDPDHVKEVCFAIQVSLVKFFTTAVNTIRSPESAIQLYKQETGNCLHGQEGPGSSFQSEFIIVTQSLSEVLARIDNLIPHQSTLTEEINSLDVAAVTNQVPLLELPTKTYSNFFNRVETFDKIDEILSRDGSTTNLRSTALYGLGGVGKSSIAAGYMNRKIEEKKYDALFWVYSEDTAALRQSFTDIAIRLKLPGAQPNLHDENLKLVQNWLQTTCKQLDFSAAVFS